MKASPIFWKAKTVQRVCHSSKDAGTLNISRMVDNAVFAVRHLEMLLFGNYEKRIDVKLFTDSESMLESMASSRQVDRKTLRMTVKDLKDRLHEGDITSYAWLPTDRIIVPTGPQFLDFSRNSGFWQNHPEMFPKNLNLLLTRFRLNLGIFWLILAYVGLFSANYGKIWLFSLLNQYIFPLFSTP